MKREMKNVFLNIHKELLPITDDSIFNSNFCSYLFSYIATTFKNLSYSRMGQMFVLSEFFFLIFY